jgi:NAD(P)-dependent dehydrogenase (short-subunit alcohol dehydrogenase family)
VPSAIVTGGSSGIGLAIAEMLKADGFDLTLASRTREKIEAAARRLGAQAVQADVRREDNCARVVATHRERYGTLDVLVNSAGVGIAQPIDGLTADYLDRLLDINVRGLLLMVRESLGLLRASRGWIVNVASIAGTEPVPGLVAYGATKAAVIAATRTLSAELDEDGVRAVALCPGFVDTEMARWSGIEPGEMIRPEDCAEVVRMCLRLSRSARVPQIVIERAGSTSGVG